MSSPSLKGRRRHPSAFSPRHLQNLLNKRRKTRCIKHLRGSWTPRKDAIDCPPQSPLATSRVSSTSSAREDASNIFKARGLLERTPSPSLHNLPSSPPDPPQQAVQDRMYGSTTAESVDMRPTPTKDAVIFPPQFPLAISRISSTSSARQDESNIFKTRGWL